MGEAGFPSDGWLARAALVFRICGDSMRQRQGCRADHTLDAVRRTRRQEFRLTAGGGPGRQEPFIIDEGFLFRAP